MLKGGEKPSHVYFGDEPSSFEPEVLQQDTFYIDISCFDSILK